MTKKRRVSSHSCCTRKNLWSLAPDLDWGLLTYERKSRNIQHVINSCRNSKPGGVHRTASSYYRDLPNHTFESSALGPVIVEATSHPSLFAFSEILAVPTVAELEGVDNSVYLDVLRLLAHGTWTDYKIVSYDIDT
ncbi:cop9 complex subunit 7a, putative [Ricinus communis]|uniref:Cop9 complex subunit 7a, putative n=1 Tax=Ricinus communis TaxID=3988 RepID=B9RVR0_RICCO|nr:cop9 complex subunit 7a, putative [Ricinus communis]